MAIGGYTAVAQLGGLIIWCFKGFKGTYKEAKENKYATYIGVGLIFLAVFIMSKLTF